MRHPFPPGTVDPFVVPLALAELLPAPAHKNARRLEARTRAAAWIHPV